ncbi:DUF5024 domain-containing protein [Parabacteroides faecis]|uniref:DUF5024 domain-containing protein n=1 Tax=Parabacteroides faecis TaxID=1217282 RepID=A0ABR6KP00_9BACT|nr:DUF5024 domain-containing protein [Parabacteroides faecis]MBB4623235.1 hypothetical protein [Parabacteroides faecis]GGJ99275.1 hypothetical protein GCM10007084_23370 [Parabacteroides faecis]
MKAKKTILLCVALLMGCMAEGLKAQEHLNALMKKCENMDTIDMNVIYNKNRETKKTEKIIKTVTFSNNQKLLDEFVAAFEKDKDAAYKIIDDKKSGKLLPSFYRFGSGKNDISYSLSVSKSGKITVSKIERFDYDPKKSGNFDFDFGSTMNYEYDVESASMSITTMGGN